MWSAGTPFAAAGGSNVSMSDRALGGEGARTAGCEWGRPSNRWPSCARAGRPRHTCIQRLLSTFSSQCVMRLGGTGAEVGFLTPMRAEPQGQRCGPPPVQPWAVRRTGCAVGYCALALWWAVWCACCRVGPILQLQLLLLTRCALWTGVLYRSKNGPEIKISRGNRQNAHLSGRLPSNYYIIPHVPAFYTGTRRL